MSDETDTEEVTQEEQSEEREYTETEKQAMQKGWDPAFEGDENKRAVTAEEFLDRQQLYDDLRKRGKENKQLKKDIEALKESHKVVAEQAYKRAKRELEKEKRQAYEEGDTDKALQIDKEMSDLDKDQEKIAKDEGNTNEAAKEAFDSFRESNPWYDNDPELRGYAEMIGSGMINMDPEKANNDPEKLFEEVAAEVKKRFPEKFKGGRGNRSGSVEGESPSGGKGGKKRSLRDIPEEHREVAKRVIESGVISEEQYVKDYLGES